MTTTTLYSAGGADRSGRRPYEAGCRTGFCSALTATLRRLITICLIGVLTGSFQSWAQEPPAAAAQPAGNGDFLAFNFEQVDIRVFTQLVGEFTGRRFVVADDVDGRITVVSPRVARDEAYRLFVAVLESAGHTVVADGDVYRVVKLPPQGTGMGTIVAEEEAMPDGGLVTRILHLEHVTANEMRKLLEAHTERKEAISALDETNHLIITDTASTIRRIEEIVRQLDQPGSARITEVVALKHADAVKLAQQLGAAMAESQSRAEQLLHRIPPAGGVPSAPPALRAPTIVAAEHANRLVLSGTARQIQSLKDLIEQMDVDAPTGRSHLNALFLNYIKAEDAAESITSLLQKAAERNPDSASVRRIAVEASSSNNALLVDAAPQDFESVRQLITALDISPQQVHISVLIAEVAESSGLTLGVEMTALPLPKGVGDRTGVGGTRLGATSATEGFMDRLQQGVFGTGLSVGVSQGAYVTADGHVVPGYPGFINIDAIKQDGRVKILSETSLGAQNNQEASVGIVDEIPILESTIQGGSGTARDVIQNIKRTDVGVKLRMVPHIVPNGQVRLELEPSIEAVTSAGTAATQFAPTIAKRTVSTTVTVPDGRTIVIAGLTRSDQVKNKRKIPLLGDIPLLGWLFSWNTEEETKTNILIFVTPRIVESIEQADTIRQELETRTGLEALLNPDEVEEP